MYATTEKYEDTTSDTGTFNSDQESDSDFELEPPPRSPKEEWRYDKLSAMLKNGQILNLRHYYDVSFEDRLYHNGVWYESMEEFFKVHDLLF